MDLLLWRHAEAEDSFPDETRKLTPRGEQQAKQMAKWINKHAPKELRIIASPALRCQQTAQALGRPFETDRRLATSGDVADLLTVAGWPIVRGAEEAREATPKITLIVGHQPTLGRGAACLLSGEEDEWSVKKGAVWWFSHRTRGNETKTTLRASLAPELID